MIGFKVLPAVVFFSYSLSAQAQNDSLLKQKKTYVYSKYTMFAFYDALRLAGLGAEYRQNPSFGIDLKIGAVYAGGLAFKALQAAVKSSTDYKFNQGAGIVLSPKQYLGKTKSLYIGLYASLYKYGFKNKAISMQEEPGYGTFVTNTNGSIIYSAALINQTVTQYETKSTKSYAFGFTAGFSKCVKRINYEFFIAGGVEEMSSSGNYYQTVSPLNSNYMLYKSSYSREISAAFNFLAGIKLGLGFKQQQLINYKYYTTLLKTIIQEEDKFVQQLGDGEYQYAEAKEAYYKYRYKMFKGLKEMCKNAINETDRIETETKRVAKKIKEYVNDNLKEMPLKPEESD
jgi:hypothetical protein